MFLSSESSKGNFIRINPDFKNDVLQKLAGTGNPIGNLPIPSTTHINPLFINPPMGRTTTIHMNPQFLNKPIVQQNSTIVSDTANQKDQESQAMVRTIPKVQQTNKIISQSRTRIVRESHAQMKTQMKIASSSPKEKLLVLTKCKLIRAPVSTITKTITSSDTIRKKQRLKVINKVSNLTGTVPLLKRRPCSFVARYALKRSNSVKDKISPLSVAQSPKNNKKPIDSSKASMNKQLRLININGILYKSTGNKLQRKVDSTTNTKPNELATIKVSKKTIETLSCMKTSKVSNGRTLYVRGAKYIMDPMGFKLTRVTQSNVLRQPSTSALLHKPKSTVPSSTNRTLPRRIDIGGITYLASSQSKNVFMRTSTHLVLAHLHHAKQRSVHVLSRSLTKTNKPCLIFQRLGKCAALERNRCSKVHDKERIIMCPKFLQGLCFNEDCPLSHNKTLQKMPVCRFFLQGSCVRTDCPYLHKKLREDSEICEDFRRGFCALAEQCNKLHVFSGGKSKPNVTQNLRGHPLNTSDTSTASDVIASRYFNKSDTNSDNIAVKNTEDFKEVTENEDEKSEGNELELELGLNENNSRTVLKRKQLGPLPACIPLS